MRFHVPALWRADRGSWRRTGAPGRRLRRPTARPQFDGLESRRLLTLFLNEFSVYAGNNSPEAITVGPDGNLWYTGHGADSGGSIGRVDPGSGVIAEVATPGIEPFDITSGPDGNLWFTDDVTSRVGEVDPTTFAVTVFSTPTPQSAPTGIAAGPDGNLWFTESGADRIGMIDPTTDVITEFPTATGAAPNSIAAGPDGNMWFTEPGTDSIGEINPTTHAIAEFPATAGSTALDDITAGPDGNLWFTGIDAGGDGYIGEFNPTTHVVSAFATPTAASDPTNITVGPDGALWFIEAATHTVGRIDPTTHAITEFSGAYGTDLTTGPDGDLWLTGPWNDQIYQLDPTTVTYYAYTTPVEDASPSDITAGPDGALWFTEAASQIGRIDPVTDVTTEFPLPTADAEAGSITTGPDGNLWFTESTGKIGRLDPSTGAVTEFPITGDGISPQQITAGPDGDLWFTATDADGNGYVGEIDPTNGAVDLFPTPTAASGPAGIAAGPDGDLWFTESEADQIGVIDPTTHAIAEFPIPTPDSIPVGITSGPDGDLWFAESGAYQIGSIDPTTHAVTEFSISDEGLSPQQIIAGPDGNLWFNAYEGDASLIAEMDPTTEGIDTASPPFSDAPVVAGVAVGPDGNIWYTDQNSQENGIGDVVLGATQSGPGIQIGGTSPSSVPVGSDLTFSITLTNDGTANDTNVALSDSLPAGATFVSATGGITPADGVLDFDIGVLPGGASRTFTVVVAPTASGTLVDTATVTDDETDDIPSFTLQTSATQATTADLGLSADVPTSVVQGSDVTETLTVRNDGPSGANGVIVTATMPGNAGFLSATGGITPADGVLTFRLGDLAAGASTTVEFVVDATTPGTLSGSATVVADQTDPDPANDGVTTVTTVTPTASGATGGGAAPTVGTNSPTVLKVRRYGIHMQPTVVVLTFSTGLDPTRADDVRNYEIVDPAGQPIAVRSAVYDAAEDSVTLRPSRRIDLHETYQLRVVGTGALGVASGSDVLLDGAGDGDPGSDYVTTLNWKNVVLTPAEVRKYLHPKIEPEKPGGVSSHPSIGRGLWSHSRALRRPPR